MHRRPVGLRQDHAAEDGVRPAGAVLGDGRAGRRGGDRAARADGARLPGLQPVAVPVDAGGRERRLSAAPQEAEQGGAQPNGPAGRRVGRAGGLDRPVSVAALRRHAAARGDRPRARLPARDPAHGRAVRLGRRADPRRPRGPRPEDSRRLRHHRPVRHPRHRRVGLHGRPRGDPHRPPVARAGGARDRPAAAARPGPDQGAARVRAPARARLPGDQGRRGSHRRRRRASSRARGRARPPA